MVQEKIAGLKQWREGIPAGPITLELNLTNRCNLNCPSCWQREFPPSVEDAIPMERAIALVREAAAMGVREVRIPGAGEPLLRGDLFDIMGEVKRLGMHGLLITNGTLWTEGKVRRTVKMGWDIVTFSVDAPSPEENDRLRGKRGAFVAASRALDMFRTVKGETASATPALRITAVLSNANYRKLPEMVLFASEHGCEDLQLQPMTVWGDGGKALELTPAQRAEMPAYLERAIDEAERLGIGTNLHSLLGTSLVEKASGRMDERIAEQTASCEDSFLRLPCFEPFYNIVILPDGKASFCSVAGGRDGESVLDRSLAEVWHGRPYRSIRRVLLDGSLPEYCKRCCSAINLENARIRSRLALTCAVRPLQTNQRSSG